MGSLRGFGLTFDIRSGGLRSWYTDREGVRRWTDNDEMVPGPGGLDGDEPTPERGGEDGGR